MRDVTWYLYDSGAGHPFRNMAMDETLLACWSGPSVILRFYAWDPPGLSLGYFQRYGEMTGNEAVDRAGAVMTRRITGGDAILHYRELTFSLVGTAGRCPFEGPVADSYHRIHEALAVGFRELGIETRPRAPGNRLPAEIEGDRVELAKGRCFYRITRFDLVSGSRKLVGSAQRRTRGKVLHHGSVPLTANPLTPEAAHLSGLADREISYGEAAERIRGGFEKLFKVRFTPWQPDPKLLAASSRLADSKYGASRWIQRR